MAEARTCKASRVVWRGWNRSGARPLALWTACCACDKGCVADLDKPDALPKAGVCKAVDVI